MILIQMMTSFLAEIQTTPKITKKTQEPKLWKYLIAKSALEKSNRKTVILCSSKHLLLKKIKADQANQANLANQAQRNNQRKLIWSSLTTAFQADRASPARII